MDVARRLDPDGKIAVIAEILNHYNEILDDITFMEGNLPTGHKVTVRSSLPTPTWRLLNKGVTQTKSTSKQLVETCGIMEAYSEVDKDVAMLNGNTQAYRYTEDLAHIEAMNQMFATTLIYGDTSTDPEQFVGLAPRYYQKVGGTATTNINVLDAGGGATLNTSIWLVGWSESTVTGIYPKGSKAGLVVEDLGEQTVYDANGLPFQAYRTHFQWKCGISVKDWRYVVRIANINTSDATLGSVGDGTDNSANLLKYMSQAADKFPPNGMVRPVFYANQTVRAALRVKLFSKSNAQLTMQDLEGPVVGLKRPTLHFMGIPVRRLDEITNTESQVTTST